MNVLAVARTPPRDDSVDGLYCLKDRVVPHVILFFLFFFVAFVYPYHTQCVLKTPQGMVYDGNFENGLPHGKVGQNGRTMPMRCPLDNTT